MVKKKVHKQTKKFVEGQEASKYSSNELSTNWQGRVIVIDAQQSEIAKRVGFEEDGEYAIKVR